jgi:hypothetical protein
MPPSKRPPGALRAAALGAILALLALAPTARAQEGNASIVTGATTTPGGTAAATGSVGGTGESRGPR